LDTLELVVAGATVNVIVLELWVTDTAVMASGTTPSTSLSTDVVTATDATSVEALSPAAAAAVMLSTTVTRALYMWTQAQYKAKLARCFTL
jgi:hypothetical protein